MSLLPKKSGKEVGRSWFDEPFDNLFEGFFMPARVEQKFSMNPRIDVNETDKAYEIKADLPGMKKEDIEISVDEGTLTISAVKEDEYKEEKEGEVIRRERFSGQYLRRLPLGAIDEQHIDASLKDGVLEIKVPKLAEAPANKVKIDIK